MSHVSELLWLGSREVSGCIEAPHISYPFDGPWVKGCSLHSVGNNREFVCIVCSILIMIWCGSSCQSYRHSTVRPASPSSPPCPPLLYTCTLSSASLASLPPDSQTARHWDFLTFLVHQHKHKKRKYRQHTTRIFVSFKKALKQDICQKILFPSPSIRRYNFVVIWFTTELSEEEKRNWDTRRLDTTNSLFIHFHFSEARSRQTMVPSQSSAQTDLDTELQNVDSGLNLPSLQPTGLGESRYSDGETLTVTHCNIIQRYQPH